MKYGIVKLWFYYTDDSTEVSGYISPCVGVCDSKEVAIQEVKELDRIALKDYLKYNFEGLNRTFLNWISDDEYEEKTNELIKLLRSPIFKGQMVDDNKDYTRMYFSDPMELSNKQIDLLIELLEISFHQIVEYNNVKFGYYGAIDFKKMNHDIFFEMMQNDQLLPGGFMKSSLESEWGLVVKNKVGYKYELEFNTQQEAEEKAYTIFKEYLEIYPQYFELTSRPIHEIASKNLDIIKSFIRLSESFDISKVDENIENIRLKGPILLNELKSILSLMDASYVKVVELENSINNVPTSIVEEGMIF